jgi:hypothetical protein
LTFDTAYLQTPDNWEYGSEEDFRLVVLVIEEDSAEWNNYIRLLKEWIEFMLIPWDRTSPLYEYHRARFEYQYVAGKLAEMEE